LLARLKKLWIGGFGLEALTRKGLGNQRFGRFKIPGSHLTFSRKGSLNQKFSQKGLKLFRKEGWIGKNF